MATAIQFAPVPAHELVYEPNELPRLKSNVGDYLDQTSVGWMRETPISMPLEEMRRRFEEDGYVFVKSVLPREAVLDMREAYFAHLAPTGILKPGTSPRDGIFDDTQDPIAHHGNGGTDLPGDLEKVKKLEEAHSMPFYLAFLKHPKLRTFVQEFMGWKKDVLVTRTLLRHNVPNGLSTGLHYDKLFLRAGEADFLTAWVPIGDCSAAGGGLTYLEDSTSIGEALEADFMTRAEHMTKEERIRAFNSNMNSDGHLSHNAAQWTQEVVESGKWNKSGQAEQKRRRWLIANFEAGDIVFHNPYMVHVATKNEDPQGRIRLATDLRFYEEGASLDERWMKSVWKAGDGL